MVDQKGMFQCLVLQLIPPFYLVVKISRIFPFQKLVFATSLNLAIKIHGRSPSPIDMKTFVEFSKNEFSFFEMSDMEQDLLRVLNWKIHPPTPFCFALEILRLIVFPHLSELVPHSSITSKTLEVAIFDATTYLIELSAFKYGASEKRPSSVALSCVSNVMEDVVLTLHPKLPSTLTVEICQKLENLTGIKVDFEEVSDLKLRIHEHTNAKENYNDKSFSCVLSQYSDLKKGTLSVSNSNADQQSPRSFPLE